MVFNRLHSLIAIDKRLYYAYGSPDDIETWKTFRIQYSLPLVPTRDTSKARKSDKRLLESLAIAIESGVDARNRKKLERDETRAFGFLPSLQSRIAARRALAHV
ncbi:hypothetical protein VNO78_02837 [Psophocarpus tetragonolobus]|uniref:Uncharacterized protein n=1 Tax=Psophocarpus tetragonolobus TaxID=3891 RepID=A0AAN9XWD8_PSOTE